MPYLGKQSEQVGVSIQKYEFLQATDTSSGTTSFSVPSDAGDHVNVWLNGVLLVEGASNDYTTTSTTVVFGTAPADGDIVRIDVVESFSLPDALKSSGDTMTGPLKLDGGLKQQTSQDLSGTYAYHQMMVSDAFTVAGDVTISDNLILTKISDDSNAITLTDDGSTRTITGTGSLETSTIAQTPNSSLTGMTGELGSAVTGSPNLTLGNATFPSGHIVQVHIESPGFADTDFEIANGTKTDADGLGVTISNLTAGNKLLVQISGGYSRSYGASGAYGAMDHLIVASPNTGSDAVIGGGKDYHRAGAEAGSNYKHFHVNVSGVYTIPSGVTSVEILRRVVSHVGNLNVSWNSTAATVPITCSIMEIQG